METLPPEGATILLTDTAELFEAAVTRAAELLKGGAVVALPTETVYGLAGNALDPKAIGQIFEIKGRPAHNPIIAHVADLPMARRCVSAWPSAADRLAKAFWPGPLTLVLPRGPEIPDILTAGGNTVGIRWPSHPFIQAVIRRCGFPLAAPSANLSNCVSPTNAQHVFSQIGRRVRLIVDGGQCQVGIESTVVDLTSEPPRVLRPGMIHSESLLTVLDSLDRGPGPAGGVLKSPGLQHKHYAPCARLVLHTWTTEAELYDCLRESKVAPAQVHVIAHTHIPSDETLGAVHVIPHDAEAYARALYAQLHECDRAGAQLIVVEAPPQANEWKAVWDRLNRASR